MARRKAKQEYLVTKSGLQNMIENAEPHKRAQIIGRACVVLFNRQTEDEQNTDQTRHDNMRGFTSGDAKSGSLTAKSFLKHRDLRDWQVERWTKKNVKGTMRIAKYWRQLNEAAIAKQKRLAMRQYGAPVTNLKAQDITPPEAPKKGTIVPLVEKDVQVFA